jgi:hypothetical protein
MSYSPLKPGDLPTQDETLRLIDVKLISLYDR